MSKANLSESVDPAPSSVDAVAARTRSGAIEAWKAGDYRRALELARRSAILHPAEPLLTYFMARNAFTLERGAEARAAFRRTTVLDPTHTSAWRYLGIQNFMRQDGAAARTCWRRTALLDPTDNATYRNLFQAARQEGAWEDAEHAGRRSMAIRPGDDGAAFDLGMMYLALGRWAEGWPLYDRRIRLAAAKPDPDRFALPYWDGTPDPSLHLLVWADQNVGDEMQFAQLLPELTQRVGRVTLECDARLVPVFARSFPPHDVIARTDHPNSPPGAGAQIPQGHLGRLLRSEAAAFEATPSRWLAADTEDAARLRSRYRSWSDGMPVVGIAWKSANQVFRGKNVPLEDWTPILHVPGLRFLSLQYGAVESDLDAMRAFSGVEVLHDPTINALHDLDGFGAQLEAVDLVISISNSTIHQACGLGRPVWAMLHVRPDWRWGVEGERCPWFPSLRLFRQTVRYDWKPVAHAVAEALGEWVAGRGPA